MCPLCAMWAVCCPSSRAWCATLHSGNQQGVHALGTVRKVKERAEMKLWDSKQNQLQQVTVSQQV